MQTILLIEDHDLIRAGLVAVLERLRPGQLEIRECGTLRQAIRMYGESPEEFDLVILDLNLPDTKGLAGLRSFKTHYPTAPVIVLSGSIDDAISAEALSLGASLYIQKTTSIEILGNSIVDQLSGNAVTSAAPQLTIAPDSPEARKMSLKPREIEVLNLVLQGLSNQEIVAATELKLGTVKNYISVLLTTFNVTSRTRLVSLFN